MGISSFRQLNVSTPRCLFRAAGIFLAFFSFLISTGLVLRIMFYAPSFRVRTIFARVLPRPPVGLNLGDFQVSSFTCVWSDKRLVSRRTCRVVVHDVHLPLDCPREFGECAAGQVTGGWGWCGGGCVFCSESRKIAVEIRFKRLCRPDERVSSARTRFPYKVRGRGRGEALERATLDDYDESVAPRGYTVIVTRTPPPPPPSYRGG